MLMILRKGAGLDHWRENSNSPSFNPKWAELYLDTLGSFKEKR